MVERDIFRDENFTIFLNPGYIKDAFKGSGWCVEDIRWYENNEFSEAMDHVVNFFCLFNS